MYSAPVSFNTSSFYTIFMVTYQIVLIATSINFNSDMVISMVFESNWSMSIEIGYT